MKNDLELKLKAKNIKLVVFDIDGVMTDGSLTYLSDGTEAKTFNAKDGQGIVMLNKAGIKTAIITAKESPIVIKRAEVVGISKVFMGEKNKINAFNSLLDEFKISKDEAVYMGDDYPDLCVINEAGLSACPNDAIDEVKSRALFVSSYNGGKGAVRELCDFILASKGITYQDIVSKNIN